MNLLGLEVQCTLPEVDGKQEGTELLRNGSVASLCHTRAETARLTYSCADLEW
jgi:hypothetical protein